MKEKLRDMIYLVIHYRFLVKKIEFSYSLLNFGGQYRLFYESLTDNLRPYISLGVGPTMLVTTPAEIEFFKSFKKAKAIFGLGGYIGFGANFGLNPSNLTGINVRYYFVQLFNDGIEQYYDEYKKNFPAS